MGFIERRQGRYRARYRDPLGRQLSGNVLAQLERERSYERCKSTSSEAAGSIQAAHSSRAIVVGRASSPWRVASRADAADLSPRLGQYILPRLAPTGSAAHGRNREVVEDEIEAGIASSSVHRPPHYRTFRRRAPGRRAKGEITPPVR